MLIWTLFQLAVMIGASYATAYIVQGNIDALIGGASVESVQMSSSLQSFLLALVELVFTAILYAAVQRAIIRPTEGGPGWLKIGMDEVRYYLLILLFLIIFTVATIVASVVLGLFFAGTGPDGGRSLAIVLLVIGFVACSYFGTKASLTFPVTLKEKSFSIGEGWGLSNGHFWTLYGTYLIIFLILVALALVNLAVTQPDYISAVFEHGLTSPEAQLASIQQSQQLMSGNVDVPIVVGWVFGAVQATICTALSGGAAATAVQQLTTDEEGLHETFS